MTTIQPRRRNPTLPQAGDIRFQLPRLSGSFLAPYAVLSGEMVRFATEHRGACWCCWIFRLCLTAMLLAAPAAWARINVVTLPGRDTVQLTIYNSADLTLVKETQVLTFRKGLNRLEFSWANTLIDPTSVEFRAVTHADAVDTRWRGKRRRTSRAPSWITASRSGTWLACCPPRHRSWSASRRPAAAKT
jgi:hypothetical protein